MQKFFKVSLFVVLFLFFVQNVSAREPWAPCKGTSKVTQSGTWQTFTFTCSAAGNFDAPSTYECETQVSGRKFADSDGGYCESNLPRKYYDTQIGDCWPFASADVDNFAVGSAEARLIFGGTKYSTYMRLKKVKKGVNSATVRIKGQKGHRVIDKPGYVLRYSTWNVKADATSSALCVLTAPSSEKSWTY